MRTRSSVVVGLALVSALLALLAPLAAAAEDAHAPATVPAAAPETGPSRAALEAAQALVDRALAALAKGSGAEAVDLMKQARSTAPGVPVVAYDHGVALSAAGQPDEARDAYREALRAGRSSLDGVAVAARHNLGLLQLLAARDVQSLLQTPGALEDAVRAHGAPGGQPLTPSTVTMLASQLRGKAIDDGLKNAHDAIDVLRDSVRTLPGDRDAVRNLVLAQRVRRFLEEQKKQDEQQQSDQKDKGDENGDKQKQDDEQQNGQGDDGKSDEQGTDDKQKPSAGDEAKKDDAQQEPGQDGKSTAADGDSKDERVGEQRDLGREEAERALDQLLDAARLKARQVERMRADRLRRGAVEKDW